MSPLAALDATRICSRACAEADAWARPIPTRERVPQSAPPFSWRAMVRNPNALIVTAAVGTIIAKDALLRAVTG